tara:strand:+ start:510 stop:854 length:345 start_codon:yes stop_codon:yes gene_type:complete
LSRWGGTAWRFGDDAYAIVELVAELGAALLCAGLGGTLTPRPDHATYLDHWLRTLKVESKVIFAAASKAGQAIDCLRGLQPPAFFLPPTCIDWYRTSMRRTSEAINKQTNGRKR